jgi:hypothetical protein
VVRDLHAHLEAIRGATPCSVCVDDDIIESFATVVWFLDSHPLVGGAVRSDPDIIRPASGVSVSPIIAVAVAVIIDRIAASAFEHGPRLIDREALTEVMTRLIQSLLLTRGKSAPFNNRNDVVGYARRCIVPLVSAMTTPGAGW